MREDNATGNVRGRPWGWHGFGVARAGLVGNGDPRSLPTAGRLLCVGRMKCLSCPDRPSAVPVQDTRPQRAENPGVARIAVAAIPDRDAIAAYDQPCILDGSCGDPAPGGLGRSARRLPWRLRRSPSATSCNPARVLAVLAVICSCAALIELTREVGRS